MPKPILRLLALATALGLLAGCAATSHLQAPTELGQPSSSAALERQIEQPGPIELQTIASADWAVPLAGLVNLSRPAAAGLKNRDEPIQIYAHLLKHPRYGYFLIDSGVSERFLREPGKVGVSWLMRQAMPIHTMQLRKSTAQILQDIDGKLAGVFFTHLHFDHIAGMPDIADNVPLYIGRREASQPEWINLFMQASTDHLLQGKQPLHEWPFQPDPQQRFNGVVDIFGDASVFAISVPGHTAGSTAYLIRSTQGPVLLTGDASHTRWGWEHGVEPGDFTRNNELNLQSLLQMKALVERHPQIEVRFGHQR